MKAQLVTKGIVLSRRDYGEADRILNILTPDNGRIGVIAKGVRRPKSKIAGGIELFTVNDLTIMPSRSDLKTLISSRMDQNFGNIVKDIHKTMLGYEFLKRVNRYVEDEAGPEYFEILRQSLSGLNDEQLPIELVELWFNMQLLKITGHAPNLRTDTEDKSLDADTQYLFDFESTAFREQNGGPYTSNHIKLMRLAHATESPLVLKQLKDANLYATDTQALSKNILQQSISS